LDVQEFSLHLEDNIIDLHDTLQNRTYRHGGYQQFIVHDPKRRVIHKASVRDRLVHHAVIRVIEPVFDRHFIFDSWSCRKGKGTHAAVDRLQALAWSLSRNDTRTVWALKLDIRKYFASVDQAVLIGLIRKRIDDDRLIVLLENIIGSFPAGFPLGNLTSQLFANVYLNELDQFAKHELRPPAYVRYCDDFILLHNDRPQLIAWLGLIKRFLSDRLHLIVHPDKIVLQPYHRGIDFLGYVNFPHFRILRIKTAVRMIRRINSRNVPSYWGVVSHCRSHTLWSSVIDRAANQHYT
jgi:retron-type reverse transcriptase